MKEFWCGAVIPNCAKRFKGQNETEILTQVAEHARKDHGIEEVPSEVISKVRSLIREVA